MYTFKKENSWRRHQSDFIIRRRKKTLLRRSGRLAVAAAGLAIIALVLAYLGKPDRPWTGTTPRAVEPSAQPARPQIPRMSKHDLRQLIRSTEFLNAEKNLFFIDTPARSHAVRTRLDSRLQAYLANTLSRLKTLTRGKPQRIALVGLDGNTGFIKAMAGFDLDAPDANPCTASDYPAASLFKIVTAAAAIDALGYTAETPLYFNGNKYTLYKRQLTNKRNKYTSRVTLARAFADSINPVFGKIGQLELGREPLNAYAHGFGFNHSPALEMDMGASRFAVTESDYHLAELGCGFNRQTEISPLFGAMMVTSILNQGNILVPRLVDQVETADGDVMYKSRRETYKTPVTPETAREMIRLMQKTISGGTARKSFRGYARDSILSTLVIGGKTGSLYNKARTVKYDWFTGFGREKSGGKALVVSVVVGHRKYIGTRASTHARNMLKQYFTPASQPGNQG